MTGEDGVETSNHTSVRNTDILHLEDADQTTIYNGSFNQFTSTGFDITINNSPASNMYYIYYVIQ